MLRKQAIQKLVHPPVISIEAPPSLDAPLAGVSGTTPLPEVCINANVDLFMLFHHVLCWLFQLLNNY